MKKEVPATVDNIIRYEEGEMSWEEEVAFFQGLINSGMAWTLQGHYGRTAKCYIDCGYCKPAKRA